MSRTGNALRNTKYAIISKVVVLLVGFISRTIFIKVLGTTYLGINGLYTEVLAALSLAELGFGTALTFAMYKPVAKNDAEKTKQLLQFYKHIYYIVAGVVLCFGLLLLPFLQYIVKGAELLTIKELRIYFLFFLADTVISYIVSYKYSYVNALQKNYLITNIDLFVRLISTFFQILIILKFNNFTIYLAINTFCNLLSRVLIAFYLNREFPILRSQPQKELPPEERRKIYHEVKGLFIHQFSSVAVHQTDNIIISSFSNMGVVTVGLVSNYTLLMNHVLGIVTSVFNSVSSGFGNLVADSTKENYRKVFLTANFINFWIYGFCSIAFYILIPPFISLWVGEDKLIDPISFFLIVLNCYLLGQCTVFNVARNALGDFNKDKWWALAQAFVNLVVSIWGAKKYGLVGVYVGTIASRLVYVVFRPVTMYSAMFDRSCKEYFAQLIKYLLSVTLAGIITFFLTYSLSNRITVLKFLVMIIIVLLIPNTTFAVLYYKSVEFQDFKSRIITFLRKQMR